MRSFKRNIVHKLASTRRLVCVTAAGAVLALSTVVAQSAEPVKIGLLLPYSGTYAELGNAITNGLKMAIEQNGNTLGGRDVEFVKVDGEADSSAAISNMQKLVAGDNVDFVVGPVSSGVAMGMLKVARHNKDVIMIDPNAGVAALTGKLCSPNVFRTSFTGWQTSYPMGKAAMDHGYKTVVTMAWDYAFGHDSVQAFVDGYEKAGGKVLKALWVPFPEVQFQSYLTQIAKIKPDAVFVFFAGGGAVKFVKDYAAAGLKDKIQLLGAGFLTSGTLDAQGDAANGVMTTLHYSPALETHANETFRANYEKAYGKSADVYAVQGYDTGLVLVQALKQVNGDTDDTDALIAAIENVKIDSPRGELSFSNAHNVVQNIYLRKVENGKNVVIGTAGESVVDPGEGCNL